MSRSVRRKTQLAFQNALAEPSEGPVGDGVPHALRVSAAWAWRIGLIILVGGVLLWL